MIPRPAKDARRSREDARALLQQISTQRRYDEAEDLRRLMKMHLSIMLGLVSGETLKRWSDEVAVAQRRAAWKPAVGDFVTRGWGEGDVHEVIEINEAGDAMLVRCVVAPQPFEGETEGWCEVGFEEWNLVRRYDPVEPSP